MIMAIDALQIAKEYAKGLNFGYDTVREAGECDGYKYFHYFRKVDADCHRKVRLPQIIKISTSGVVTEVRGLDERMWAVKQEVKLNNLR